jgi:hypothetical protein
MKMAGVAEPTDTLPPRAVFTYTHIYRNIAKKSSQETKSYNFLLLKIVQKFKQIGYDKILLKVLTVDS